MAARPFTPRIEHVVAQHELWYRYMPESGNWHGGTFTRWIAALSAAPAAFSNCHLSSVPRGQTERDIPYPSGKAVEFEQKLIQEVAHRVGERGYPGLSHSSFILALSDA